MTTVPFPVIPIKVKSKHGLLPGLVFLVTIILVSGCIKPDPPLRIALSRGYPDSLYANYYKWIGSLDSLATVLDLYNTTVDSAMDRLKGCSGLLLTGGTDIDPAYYDKAHDTVRCLPADLRRDSLEMRLLDSALAWGMPVLGICRGLQLINVALGGSLVVDIPQDRGNDIIHQCDDYLSCFHDVNLGQNSFLAAVAGVKEGEVNSNHHQAVDVVAPGLLIAAYAPDGIPEAIEWNDKSGKSFLLGVQWHPERMKPDNPLSAAIGKRFLHECRKSRF